jgi:BirA family transcriptional regulator, biotin operon repressor / biotin---[acetyl-CoA-carboxylase] ligase
MAVSLPSGVDQRCLLALLADGRPHSGAWLARELGTSRAAVGRGIEQLRLLRIEVRALARRGYCLPQPVELLDARQIRAALEGGGALNLRHLEILFDVDSTNARLLAMPPPPEGQVDVCLAELQHAGRGRRGRRWIAPFGGGIAMSLGCTFRDPARVDPSLSLAAGVAVCRALGRAGAPGIGLKWPNDVWFDDRKVGGVLLELRTEPGGPAHFVIGVGLNVSLSAEARREIEASGVRVAAVADACPQAAARNRTAGALLNELLSMLERFDREGFAPFRDAWLGLDALNGRAVRVLAGDCAICGTARGVDADGALLLESGGRLHRIASGEVSLQLTEGGT